MATSSALFSPYTLRGVTFRNRIWVSPMCQYSADPSTGQPSAWHHQHYGAMAAGGTGLIVLEATGVLPEGRITPGDLGLWEDAQIEPLAALVSFMHSQGAMAGIQLQHAGRKASTSEMWSGSTPLGLAEGGWTAEAPSAIAFEGYPEPRALETGDVWQLVKAFADAAVRAVAAGFDFIEIHGAHGYLVHQFLSPLTNQRSDAYGGSLENRCRFALEITNAIREAIPDDKVLAIRLSATDWVEGGWTPEETVQLVAWAKERGLDHADISTGGLTADAAVPVGPLYQVPFATQVKQGAGISTNAVGLINTAEDAENIVATGQADAVMVGRGFMRNPHFPSEWAATLGAPLDSLVPPQYSVARWEHYAPGRRRA
ncbi:MAG: NADH:flavin oxidoreductase/NADH oxidase [Bifidobacteriaceae bacterium]|jgi:2,4-dienoyl-CoA reductase-like NADH-dependent reductase (Old Yellow Enzyme family)|nr:NADH:flavin oxidoreductase/NADH oxidase [Bifidobacteriaceae bacterium]